MTDALDFGAEAAPAAAVSAAQTSAPAAASAAPVTAQAQPVLMPPAALDRTEARTAPQQESAIAQVGELREALRAARPEMTLRHAEFGLVSLRIEAAGANDWRAVLASRDPGFVPAIQAALADRGIAAAAETASTNTGTNSGGNPGQNGASEQRYGFSQGAGQGSPQPYLEQSGKRDGDGSPHQRQPRSDADEAEPAGAPDTEHSAPLNRGLFA